MAEYDLVIRGGTVFDGTGGPPVHADIGIRNGKVVALSATALSGAEATIDAAGKCCSVGWGLVGVLLGCHGGSGGEGVVDRRAASVIATSIAIVQAPRVGGSWFVTPVSSVASTMPVMGARTVAVKSARLPPWWVAGLGPGRSDITASARRTRSPRSPSRRW